MPTFLTDQWKRLKYVWMLMTLRKLNFYRELNPMARVYTQMEMVLFSFSITVGKPFFFLIPQNVLKHGDLLILFWLMYTPILFISAGCYAEMTALMPAIGAHYHYCYSTMCEFVGFLVGWNMIFAYTTISLSRCKFLGLFIDNIFLDGWISRNLRYSDGSVFWFFCIPGTVDIISPIIAISMAFQAAWAVRATKSLVNFLTLISIIVMIVLVTTFTANIDFTRVNIGTTQSSEKILDSTRLVHRALVGYESLSVLGEEAKDPTTTIPLSIMISVQILMFVYILYTFTMSICLQKQSQDGIDEHNPLGSILIKIGMPGLYWLATLGTVCSLWCCAYGTMLIAIRILYAMSRDGLIFKDFSKIDRYTRKPAIPAMIFGAFIGLFAAFLSADTMVGYFSLILAKIMTSICLLMTRYRYEGEEQKSKNNEKERERWVLLNYPEGNTRPTEITHSISMKLIYNTVVTAISSAICLAILYIDRLGEYTDFFKITGFWSIVSCIVFVIMLRSQPTNDRTNLSFIAPYVPIFPLLAIIFEFLSALILCRQTWIYGFMWTGLGVIFYFAYSIHHSQESRNLYPDGSRWNPLDLSSAKISSYSWHKRL